MDRAIFWLALGIGLAPAAALRAREPAPASGGPSAPHGPNLAVFAITECTGAGRAAPVPSAERPVYVLIHCGGQHDLGEAHAGDRSPSGAVLGTQLEAALTADHYLPATADHPPSVVLIFNWGLHGSLGPDLPDLGYRNLLDRAALVGGRRFAADLHAALEAQELTDGATSTRPWGAQLPGMGPSSAAGMFQPASPFQTFRRRDRLTERLIDEITEDVYYFIVSAFDHDALARGEQRLLWRTKLSTSTRGTSMMAAMPALIRGGAGHFGREMATPVVSSQPAD